MTTRLPWFGYLIVLAVCLGFFFSPLSELTDRKFFDHSFALTRATGAASPASASEPDRDDAIIIGIDEATVASIKEPLSLWHRPFGDVIRATAMGKARALVIDVVLPDRSYDALIPGQDRHLLAALLETRSTLPLVIAQTVDQAGRKRAVFAPLVALAGPDAFALALLSPDADGTFRTATTEIVTEEGRFPTMAGRLADILGLPVQAGLIDFGRGNRFDYISMAEVLTHFKADDREALATLFEGRVVHLGTVLPFEDRHLSPIPVAAWQPNSRLVPGVLLHAQITRSLQGGGLIPLPSLTWSLVFLLIATLYWWLLRASPIAIIVGGLALVVFAVVGHFALESGLALPVGTTIAVAIFAFLARAAVESIAAILERQKLKQSFAPYVSPAVLTAILRGELEASTGGERRHVCVLFSDIRSFTTRSESQPPEAIVALLNRYFAEMTACVHAHGGTIDKFIGDGLMAFFGAPAASANPSVDAFAAAEAMLTRLASLNDALEKEGIERVAIGIGLHVGDVVVGHVGSPERHEYTVIGDTVNTAARLEGLTKSLGYVIACSDEVYRALPEPNRLIALGLHDIKGRAPVQIYGANLA